MFEFVGVITLVGLGLGLYLFSEMTEACHRCFQFLAPWNHEGVCSRCKRERASGAF